MAWGRKPGAWAAAAKMQPENYMYVEGVLDECFWKKFIDRSNIKIRVVNGWENVVECVRNFNNTNLDHYCIGVIDSDFEQLFSKRDIKEDNIFSTDYHDIE